jgi:hypothetical protein
MEISCKIIPGLKKRLPRPARVLEEARFGHGGPWMLSSKLKHGTLRNS